MQTLLSIGLLVIYSIIAFYLATFILNIAGLPGALLAKGAKKDDGLFMFGSLVSAIGQSFIYLAYISFVVSYALEAVEYKDIGFIIWIVAFFASLVPLGTNIGIAEREAREDGYITNPQIKGLNITLVISVIGFFVFAFNPDFMESIYGWVSNII